MIKTVIFIFFCFFLLFACADVRNPVVYAESQLIPSNLAVKHLNSKYSKCNYSATGMKKGNKFWRYNELIFNTYKMAGDLYIDITIPGRDNICMLDFSSSHSAYKKYADALTSMGVRYQSGIF